MKIILEEEEEQLEIKYHGKLPNSSYYDIAEGTEILTINNNETTALNNHNNTNLFVRSCAFSPDDTHLAWICGYNIVKIMKWKNSKSRKRTLSNCKSIRSKYLNLEDSAMSIQRYPIDTEDSSSSSVEEIIEIDCAETVCSLAFGSSKSFRSHSKFKNTRVYNRFNFSDCDLLLAVGLASGKIRIFDGTTNQFLVLLSDHTEQINGLKFTKNGSLQLASASNDLTVKLWNMFDDGNMYKTLKGHTNSVRSCDWSPTAPLLCSVGNSGQAFIWDTEKFVVKHILRGHLHNVSVCEFSPDGALLATGSYDTNIILWDPYTGNSLNQLSHMLPPPRLIYASGDNGCFVRSLAFSKNGDRLVSVCDDK